MVNGVFWGKNSPCFDFLTFGDSGIFHVLFANMAIRIARKHIRQTADFLIRSCIERTVQKAVKSLISSEATLDETMAQSLDCISSFTAS